jgi:hypothetical protein
MGNLYSSASGGSEVIGTTTLSLTTPQAVGAAMLFQARYFVRIPLNAKTSQLQLDSQARLEIRFASVDLRIGLDAPTWHKTPPQRPANGEIAFDLVLPVKLDYLSSTLYPSARLYRMDGTSKAADPTLSVVMYQQLSQDFTAARFTVALDPKVQTYMLMMAPAQGASKQAQHSPQTQQAHATDELSLNIKGHPTSPRLKLATLDGQEVLWQWLDFPGEQTQDRTVTVSAATWLPALGRALALRQPGQNEIVLTLDLISDAPCQTVLTASHFQLQSQASALPADAPGVASSLRFSGEQHQCQQIPLDKPAGTASRVEVQLQITQAGGPVAQSLPPLADIGRRGFSLQGGDWLARPWPVEASGFLGGLAIPWWPLEPDATLSLSLHADQAGHPGDTPLAQASISTPTETPHWLIFRWPELMLQPGPFWLRLSVKAGHGLWLGQDAPAELTVTRQSAQQPQQHIATPLAPMAQGLSNGTIPAPPVSCSLNGTPLNLQADANDQADHWLATLAPVPAALQAASPWVLTVCSDRSLLVSVRDVNVASG